ncbi:MAG: hypothetical protein HQL82_15570, partial [Magnetococcales bacterium]|nr:hypothetical protein [Magnetococcales bacterium]
MRDWRTLDPRARVTAFVFLVTFLTTHSPVEPLWWVGVGLLATAAWSSGVGAVGLLRPLWQLKWLFLMVMALQGLFIPGHPLVDGWEFPTREGLMQAGSQGVRLAAMVLSAWLLVRTTPPRRLLGALRGLVPAWGPLGRPLDRWLAVTVHGLRTIPPLLAAARRIGAAL